MRFRKGTCRKLREWCKTVLIVGLCSQRTLDIELRDKCTEWSEDEEGEKIIALGGWE